MHPYASTPEIWIFLSIKPTRPGESPGLHKIPPPNNGAVHTISTIIKNVMYSATESEVGGIFLNAKDGTIIRNSLQNWYTNNQPPPLNLTTLPLFILPKRLSSNATPKPSAWDSTGFKIASSKANSSYFGKEETPTLPTTSPKPTPPHITSRSVTSTYTNQPSEAAQLSAVAWSEGVLITSSSR